ncbi:hypothetical protein GCM10007877_06150 [Marinibactrum halimedae]|uniref:Uncharacterized protein n=1 Tax=Marinibactrum halimedae TaxID=1444977 RepID=A0AA37T3M5_9GAMM|nr:hypothetical protein GCM10007877_06150 [Marinibactrum halimedae]
MYLDGVVIGSFLVVILTCAILVYIGRFAKRHIEHDIQQANASLNEGASESITRP